MLGSDYDAKVYQWKYSLIDDLEEVTIKLISPISKKVYMLCKWYQNYMTGVVLDNIHLKQLYLIESKSLANWLKIAKHFLQVLPDSLVINRQVCTSIPLLTNS